jgi:hypothetical protein
MEDADGLLRQTHTMLPTGQQDMPENPYTWNTDAHPHNQELRRGANPEIGHNDRGWPSHDTRQRTLDDYFYNLYFNICTALLFFLSSMSTYICQDKVRVFIAKRLIQ